jgi:excisionase family DNA binding protein
MEKLERLLTPRQVAELEGCSLTTVYDRLTDGSYQAIKDGVKTLISESSVARRRAACASPQRVRGVPQRHRPRREPALHFHRNKCPTARCGAKGEFRRDGYTFDGRRPQTEHFEPCSKRVRARAQRSLRIL